MVKIGYIGDVFCTWQSGSLKKRAFLLCFFFRLSLEPSVLAHRTFIYKLGGKLLKTLLKSKESLLLHPGNCDYEMHFSCFISMFVVLFHMMFEQKMDAAIVRSQQNIIFQNNSLYCKYVHSICLANLNERTGKNRDGLDRKNAFYCALHCRLSG